MMDLNNTVPRGDPTLSSTSRSITPTNLFDFELGNIIFIKVLYSEGARKFGEIFNLPLSFYDSYRIMSKLVDETSFCEAKNKSKDGNFKINKLLK